MKRLLQTIGLFGALAFSQQAFAQDNSWENPFNVPRFRRENVMLQDTGKTNYFPMQRFSRDNAAQYTSYNESRRLNLNMDLNYSSTKFNLNPNNSGLRNLVGNTPFLGALQRIAATEPVHVYKGLNLNFSSSSRRSFSPGNRSTTFSYPGNVTSAPRNRKSPINWLVGQAIKKLGKK